MGKKDIFDKIMEVPVLNFFDVFYKKNKEIILYLLFGGLTTVISIVTYIFFEVTFGMNELLANIFSWILAVLFAFVTNKIWVFHAPTDTLREFIKQIIVFFGGRVATLVVEEIILFVFVTLLTFPSVTVKVVAQVIVIVLNYVISKFWIF